MKFRIKQVETNVVYDDVYNTAEEAKETIEEYIADDGEERNIIYIIIDEDGEMINY